MLPWRAVQIARAGSNKAALITGHDNEPSCELQQFRSTSLLQLSFRQQVRKKKKSRKSSRIARSAMSSIYFLASQRIIARTQDLAINWNYSSLKLSQRNKTFIIFIKIPKFHFLQKWHCFEDVKMGKKKYKPNFNDFSKPSGVNLLYNIINNAAAVQHCGSS